MPILCNVRRPRKVPTRVSHTGRLRLRTLPEEDGSTCSMPQPIIPAAMTQRDYFIARARFFTTFFCYMLLPVPTFGFFSTQYLRAETARPLKEIYTMVVPDAFWGRGPGTNIVEEHDRRRCLHLTHLPWTFIIPTFYYTVSCPLMFVIPYTMGSSSATFWVLYPVCFSWTFGRCIEQMSYSYSVDL